MSKPSIFSKDYEKEMKKRKIKVFALIIIPIIMGLAIFFIGDFYTFLNKEMNVKKSINNILFNKGKDSIEHKENKDTTIQKEEKPEKVVSPEPNISKPQNISKQPIVKNEIYPIQLSDGQKLNIEYEVKGTEKNIKAISGDKDIVYDISPSKKAVVIQSKKNQDLMYLNLNGNSKNITKTTYTSSKNESFQKVDQLKNNPSYIWSITPKFIDEENIAYVSELPWINEKEIKYIWKLHIKDNSHINVKSVSGQNITFGKITTKGLEAIIDGKTVYVSAAGKIAE